MSMTLQEAMAVVAAETGADVAGVEKDADVTNDVHAVARLARFRELRAAKAAIAEAMDAVQTEIHSDMHDRGVETLSVNGKVVARRTEVESTRTDGAAFKTELPAVWAKFQKVTKSVRLTVSKS